MTKLIGNRDVEAVVDIVCILFAYLIATIWRFGAEGWMRVETRLLLVILLCAYLIHWVFLAPKNEPRIRDISMRLRNVLSCNLCMLLITVTCMFALHISAMQSRSVVGLFFVLNILLMLIGRTIYKHVLLHYFKNPVRRDRLVLFTNEENCLRALQRTSRELLFMYDICTIVVVGKEEVSRFYCVRTRDNANRRSYLEEGQGDVMDFLTREIVDDVLLSLPDTSLALTCELIQKLEMMGASVHLTVDTFRLNHMPKSFGQFGMYNVLNFYEREFTPGELFLKRAMDICVGLVGCFCCILIGLFVCPAIYLEDPGPVIFKQKRVGRNGRYFYIYKFRSMYQDAEARKKELMAQNEMNGLMFKMKEDPRITKVGKFIRKTSLDEFPQFFNVLFGSMSTVGTRPPTVDEFEQYSMHHKRRLQLKPGITGLWQATGRSDIQDFEEVVRLDCQYIDEQSIWLDIKILLMTVKAVLLRKGAD